MCVRVAILGHVAASSTSIDFPKEDRAHVESLLKQFNYTRVVDGDGMLIDHIAYLKKQLGIPQNERFSVWEMNLCVGLLLRSHLERCGATVYLANYVDSDNQDAVFREIDAFAPELVLLSTTFVGSAQHLTHAGRLVRGYLPQVFVVAGGHHVHTALMYLNDQGKRAYLLSSKLSAFVDDAQGEGTLARLVAAWPGGLAGVPNLIWKNEKGEVIINKRVPEENDINSTLIDFKPSEEEAIVHVRTARSCSFKCAFCSYPTIAGKLALMDPQECVDHAAPS